MFQRMPSLQAITCLLLLASTSLTLGQQFIISFDNQILAQTTNGMNAALSTYLKQVSNVAADYFKHLLSISSGSSSLSSSPCGLSPSSFSPTPAHLFVVISYVNEPLQDYFANGYICPLALPTPKQGVMIFNIGKIPSTITNYVFKQHLKETIHEFIHILGLVRGQLINWIDPTKLPVGTYTHESDLLTTTSLRGFGSTLLLKTPYLLQTAKDYFGCNTMTGVQLENQEDYSLGTSKLHFERSILGNEAMTATILEGDSIFSIFTGAVLKDMGYFSTVNFNFLDDFYFGKGNGCNYLTLICSDTTHYKEFVYTTTLQTCDLYGQGIGDDLADNYVDPGCVIPLLTSTSLCSNPSFTDNTTGQTGSSTSKCFSSNYNTISPPLRCFDISCSSNYSTISIKFYPSSSYVVNCGSGNQGQTITTSSGTGTITCPSDYTAFCSAPSKCPNYCSMKGFCIKGYCVCLSGNAGADCSVPCPCSSCTATQTLWDGNNCVSSCAAGTYANPSNTCLPNCPAGYYPSSGSCLQCDSKCKTCTGPSSSQCNGSCNYPYTLDSSLHTCSLICATQCLTCFGTASTQCLTCTNGYYLSGYSCLACTFPCATCLTSGTNCLTCATNYGPVAPACLPQCDSSCATCSAPYNSNACLTCNTITGKYLNGTQCSTCSLNCATCTGTSINCLSCNPSYGLIAGVCYPLCSPSNCLTCSTPSTCTTCIIGYYLNGTSCSPCSSLPSCLFCTSASNCTVCKPGFVLSGGLCSPNSCHNSVTNYNCLTCDAQDYCLSCSSNQYLQNQECGTCDSNCLTCLGNPHYCLSCYSNYTLNTTTKVCEMKCYQTCKTCTQPMNINACTTCINGYVIDVTGTLTTCVVCDSSCATCFGQPTLCTSCNSGYQLQGSTCQPICHSSCVTCSLPASATSCLTCLDTFYRNTSNTCVACVSPCANCSSSTTCLSCVTNYSLDNGQCLMNCDNSCLACDWPMSASNCISCYAGSYLTNSKQCVACSSSCKTCVSSATYCMSCQANYTLSAGTCSPVCAINCSGCTAPLSYATCTGCIPGYYVEYNIAGTTIIGCSPCVSPCSTCTSSTACSGCVANYSLSLSSCTPVCSIICIGCTAPQDSTACIACQPGYFMQGTTNTCLPCDSTCLTCVGHQSHCTLPCAANYNFIDDKCVPQCVSPCFTCANSTTLPGTNCLSCITGYYLTPSPTVSCQPCTSHCQTCDATNCYSCITGYTLTSHTCTPTTVTCAPGQYLSSSNNCLPCTSPCSACLGTSTNCTGCISSYQPVPISGICYPDCGLPCITCVTPGSPFNTCTQCSPSYFLANTGTSAAPFWHCLPCSTSCLTCVTTSSICTSCQSGYTLIGNTCILSCSPLCRTCSGNPSICTSCYSGTFLTNSSTCALCQFPCLSCSLSNINCLSCSTGYNITPVLAPTATYLNHCVQSCFDGYYLSSASTCLPCTPPCSRCITTAMTCTSCTPYNTLTSSNTCIPNSCDISCQTCSVSYNSLACTSCYPGSYLSSNQCLPCPSACLQCSSATNCTACQANYNLISGLPSYCSPVCDASCLTCFAPLSSTSCSTCLVGYTIQYLNNSCVPCDSACTACSGSTTNCSACVTGYSLSGSTCNLICSTGCATCQTVSTFCLTCLYGYVFNSATNSCSLVCHSTCATCSISNSDTACLSCNTSFQLVNSQCLPCPPATYSSGALCLDCLSDCISCTSASICVTCRPGYSLNSLLTQCIQNSPATYIISIDCNYSCSTCIDSYATCITCAANRQLTHSSNVIVGQCLCPSDTSDEGVAQCKNSETMNQVHKANQAVYATSLSVSLLAGIMSSNPLSLSAVIETSQKISFMTYVSFQQSPGGLDKTLHSLYSSHITALWNLIDLSPSNRFPFSRMLISEETKWSLSEVDSGIIASNYPREKNTDRLFLNGKTLYFLVNALPILVLHCAVWAISFGLRKIGIEERSGEKPITWRTKVRKFWCISFPSALFLMTFQELALLVLFQLKNFSFSSVLSGFSTAAALVVLLLSGFFIYHLYRLIFRKGIFTAQYHNLPAIHLPLQYQGQQQFESYKNQKPNSIQPITSQSSKIPMCAVEIIQGIPDEDLAAMAAAQTASEREQLHFFSSFLQLDTLPQRVYLFVIFASKLFEGIWSVFLQSSPAAQVALLIITRASVGIFTFVAKPFRGTYSIIIFLIVEAVDLLLLVLLAVMLGVGEADGENKTRLAYAIQSIIFILLIFFAVLGVILLLKAVHHYIFGSEKISTDLITASQQQDLLKNQVRQQPSPQQLEVSSYNNSFSERLNPQNQGQKDQVKQQPLPWDDLKRSTIQKTNLTEFDRSFQKEDTDLLLRNNSRSNSPSKDNQRKRQLRDNNNPPRAPQSRLILFDDSSNLFHFMAPREHYSFKSGIEGIFQQKFNGGNGRNSNDQQARS